MCSVDQDATWCWAPRDWRQVLVERRHGGGGGQVRVEGVQQVVGAPLMVDK